MNDRQKEILQKVVKRLDLVVLATLLALMTAAIFLLLSESNHQMDVVPTPATRAWDVRIPNQKNPDVKNPDYDELRKQFYDPPATIQESPEFTRLIRNNMFARRTAEEAAAFEAEMNQLYNQAERLFNEGKHQEAQAAITNILQQDPNNRNAQELQKRLQAILNPASPTATAAPPPQ